MRSRALIVVLIAVLALGPTVSAGHAMLTHHGWVEGHMVAGTAGLGIGDLDDGDPVPEVGLDPVSYVQIPFQVDACHRRLEVDLIFEPSEQRVEIPEVAMVSLAYEIGVELLDEEGTVLSSQRVDHSPARSTPVGTVPEAGSYRVDLYLLTGAAVDWQLRVRGWEVNDEPLCEGWVGFNEVEANPAGTDAGNEWVELHNPSLDEAADLSGWTIATTHGQTTNLTLLDGTSLGPEGYLTVGFPSGQALDNEDEMLILYDDLGRERDRTQVLSDTADDDRTNQRLPDGFGAWELAPGTPGAANPSD